MAPPVVADEPCVFNEVGEGFRRQERETFLDNMPCLDVSRLVTTFCTYPEPPPSARHREASPPRRG